MTNKRDEDEIEGEFGPRKSLDRGGGSIVPDAFVHSSGKRARVAWFSRPRGAGGVKLKVERPPGSQRVVVMTKPVAHAGIGGGGAKKLMRHALYVERDGSGRDGWEAQVFDRDLDHADAGAFVDRCKDDRRHFRVIISPEYGEAFGDLKAFTREWMGRVESDLETGLDWMAVEHHDTGRPHIHLLIRGVRDNGRALTIPRLYVTRTFREHAEELATRELGARVERDQDIDQSVARSTQAKRLTRLDFMLVDRARDHEVEIDNLPAEAGERAVLIRRLNRLGDMGLAERLGARRWRIDRELETKLVRMSEARERERATAQLLAREDRGLELDRIRELERAHSLQRAVGRLVGFERMGHWKNAPYLLGIEGVDGRFWTARIAREEGLRLLNGVERGAVLEIRRGTPGLRPADRTILEIAGEGRTYSADLHRERIPEDREAYIERHVGRLNGLRIDGIVEQRDDGAFYLPDDFEAKVLQREARGGRESAHIELLDRHSVQTQERYLGPTLLDSLGEGRLDLSQLRDAGFGRELLEAWEKRKATLRALALGHDGADGFYVAGDADVRLRKMERDRLRQLVECETGRIPHFASDGEHIEGLFIRRVVGARETLALIVHGATATLAPWRPEMDRALNQFVSGVVRWPDFDFKYGQSVEKSLVKRPGIEP